MFSLALLGSPEFVLANPQGGEVVAGSATITNTNPTTLTVDQSTHTAIINWNSFSIGAQETTRFNQPSTSAIALNRVTGGDASQILGNLSANGRIILVNPNGIFFGAGSTVDVAGLIATTANISNRDFLNGNYRFVQDPTKNFGIVNYGNIKISDTGLVALVAPGVENNGVISANIGKVILASGTEFTVIDTYGDQLIQFVAESKVQQTPTYIDGTPMPNAVSNRGTITANGGRVLLTAKTAKNIVDNAVSMDGVIEAKSIYQRHGEIILSGGDEGKVKVAGTLIASNSDKSLNKKGGKVTVTGQLINVLPVTIVDVSSTDGGGEINIQSNTQAFVAGKFLAKAENTSAVGGMIRVLGDQVALLANTDIDVSGSAGGGTILIGGNAHGAGPELNASAVYVDPNTTLTADAIDSGNGGKVVVWADDITKFYGNISARGGAQSGDGGWVEVSGKQDLIFRGIVDTSAPAGAVGTLLLDPQFIVIQNSGGVTLLPGINNLFANLVSSTVTLFATGAGSISLSVANVLLQANTDITFNDPVNITSAITSLTAQAGRSVFLNSSIQTTNQAVSITANSSAATAADRLAGAGNIVMAPGSSINAGSAAITLTIGSLSGSFTPGSITANNLTTTGANNIVLTSPNAITLNGAINAGAGTVTFNTNTSASAAQNFVMNTGSSITTTNATASAVAINVNAIGGGSGSAILDNITANGTLAVTTATGGNTTGGSITQNAGTLLTAGTITLNTPTTGASGIGSDLANILTSAGTITANSGSGGVFITESNAANFTATAKGIGDINLTSTAGTLNISGATNAVDGAITLTSGDAITLASALGNASDTGTITINANNTGTDLASFSMNAGSSITTTNTSANAVTINVNAGGGTGTATLRNITTGAGGTLTINSTGGAISQIAATSLSVGPANFTAGASAITLANTTNDFTGAVTLSNSGANNISIRDANAIILGTSNVGSGTLTITATGANTITQTGALTQEASAGTASFITGGGAITLNDNNDFTGALALTNTGANNISVTDINSLRLGTLSMGNAAGTLTVNTTGDITQSGATTITTGTGAVTFNAGANAITLTNNNNFRGAVSLNNSDANNIAITDANAVILGTSNIGSGTFTVNAAGAITQTGAITQAANAGAASFSAGTSSITLTQNNDFTGAVSLINSGAGDAAITDVNALTLDTSSIGDDLTIIAGNTITQTGSLTGSTAGSALTATTLNNDGAAITLDNSNNDFATINLRARDTTNTNNTAGAISYRNSSGFAVAGANTTSSVVLVGGGAITQTAAITGTTLTVKTLNNAGAAITLNNAGNDFTAATNTIDLRVRNAADTLNTAGIINYRDINAFDIANISTTDNLILTAAGAITQTGAITVGGTASFTAGANPITLDNATNNLAGAIAFSNSGAANNVSLNNSVATILAASTLGNNFTLTSNGEISQTGTLIIPGTSTFNAGANPITLTTPNNNFGTVVLNNTGANDVSIRDTNAIAFAASTVGNNLTITAGGTITQTGPLISNANATLTAKTLNNAGAAIILNDAGNTFSVVNLKARNATDTAFDGGAIAYAGTTGFDIAELGNLSTITINANGPIIQSGAITATGAVSFSAGANAITLTNPLNNFIGAVSLNNSGAHDVAITDANTLILGPSTLGRNLTVIANGAITQTGALTLNTLTLTNTGASTTLTNTGNAINSLGNIVATGQTFNLTNTNAITQDVGATITANNLTLLTRNDSGASINIANIGNDVTTIDLRTRNAANTANATGAITYRNDTNGFNVAAINTASTVDLTASGAITQTGAMTGTTLTAKTLNNLGANITFSNSGNDFTAINISSRNATDTANVAGNINYRDTTAVDVAGIATLGTVALTADNDITQSGAMTGASLTAKTLNNAGAAITLDGSNTFPIIDIQARNATDTAFDTGIITYTGTTGFDIATLGTTSTATINASGPITQSGIITLTGAGISSFSAGANAITFTNPANNFNTVSFNNSGNNDINVVDVNTITLADSTIGRNFTLTAGDDINQSASTTLNLGNTLSLSAANDVVLSGTTIASGPITISANTNSAGGEDFNMTTGSSITTTDTSANAVVINVNTATGGTGSAILGGITTGNNGTITVATNTGGNTTGSDITQSSGSLNVGTGTIDLATSTATGTNIGTTAARIITTAGTINAHSGSSGIFITNTAPTLNFTATTTGGSGAINLITSGNLTIAGTTSTSGTGALTLNATGAIAQLSPLTVGGTSNFTAGTHSITLTNPTNDFTGAVSLSNSGVTNDVAITNSAPLVLGTSSVGHNLTVVSGGTLSQTGPLTVPAVTNITTTAPNSDVLLNTQANNFTGIISFIVTPGNIRDVSIQNVNVGASTPILTGLTSLRNLTVNFINAPLVIESTVPVIVADTLTILSATDLIIDATAPLQANNIVIVNAGNIINESTIITNNFTQQSGTGTTNLGTNTLNTSGPATVTTNNVIGAVNVGSLSLNTNFANLTGTVNGLAGLDAARQVVLLNTISPGTHFFNGFDLFALPTPTPTPTIPTINPTNVFPYYNLLNSDESPTNTNSCNSLGSADIGCLNIEVETP